MTPLMLNRFFEGMAIMVLTGILLALVGVLIGLLIIDWNVRGRPLSKKEIESDLMSNHADRIANDKGLPES